jgi:hypothetical protein
MAEPQICRVDGCVNASAVDDLGFCKEHLQALLEWQGPVSIAVSACTIGGCANGPKSTYWPYCHKHDARIRRRGSAADKVWPEFTWHSAGYRIIRAPGHPMAKGKSQAFEHRVVYYDHHKGALRCHWCAAALTWDTMQVDHLNNVRHDNRLANLVAACAPCNRSRAHPQVRVANKARAKKLSYEGQTRTLTEWADLVGISRNAFITRLENGWSVERAITEPRGRFGPKN